VNIEEPSCSSTSLAAPGLPFRLCGAALPTSVVGQGDRFVEMALPAGSQLAGFAGPTFRWTL
jgi:hypothetical protein